MPLFVLHRLIILLAGIIVADFAVNDAVPLNDSPQFLGEPMLHLELLHHLG
jgi:hypothetical protein